MDLRIDVLEDIKQDILKNMKCPLKDNATNLVFGKGNPYADIMFIGEAPGKNEDLQGLPFVGKAGEQLNRLLNVIDLNIDDVYIANILKFRPPNNRNPENDEIVRHTPYLIRQIGVIKPKIIATLGNYATKFVLSGFCVEKMNKVLGISQIHGKVFLVHFNDISFKVVPIYHPAAMLYNPNIKESFENDFMMMKKIIESSSKDNS